jgi:uncharacterized protein YybS (DUF2232 family)
MFAVAGLAGAYLPPLYFLSAMLLPLPAMMIVLKIDASYALLGLGAAGLVFFILMPPPAASILIFQYGLLGVLYGLLFKNRISSGKTLATGMLYAGVSAFLYLILNYFTGNNLFVLGEEGRIAAYRDMGAYNGIPSELQGEISESLISALELLIPGQYIVNSAALAAITYFFARAWLQRLKYSLAPGLAFTMISLPWYTIWGPIAGLALTLAGDNFSWVLAAKTGKNILFILFWLYIVTGLSVALYYLQKINMIWVVKLIILIFALAYLPFSMVALILLGLVDPLVNFRRLPPRT